MTSNGRMLLLGVWDHAAARQAYNRFARGGNAPTGALPIAHHYSHDESRINMGTTRININRTHINIHSRHIIQTRVIQMRVAKDESRISAKEVETWPK